MRELPEGLVFDGHDSARPDVLAQARTHLVGAGMHPLDADDVLADRKGLVVRAWWGGDDVGFVGEEHPQAQPVTVVHC
jgi:hypothetical protein